LLNKAEEGDKNAVQALAKQAHQIGRGLGPIIAGLSPRVILVAGDITSAWRRFGPPNEKEAAELPLAGEHLRIMPTHDGDIARLRGAAALVFQSRFVREPSQSAEQSPPRPKS
jgi:predicted NBD/HSP70 family sugar kinase